MSLNLRCFAQMLQRSGIEAISAAWSMSIMQAARKQQMSRIGQVPGSTRRLHYVLFLLGVQWIENARWRGRRSNGFGETNFAKALSPSLLDEEVTPFRI